jgi:hypothetical protein
MATSAYVVAVGTDPLAAQPRASELGTNVCVGDPTGGLVAVFPSAVVTSPALAAAIFPDDVGEATLAEVQAAMAAAVAAEQALATNAATIRADVLSRQATLKAWMTANAAGAVLTAAQTLVVAEMLDGLCDLLLQLFSSAAQT